MRVRLSFQLLALMFAEIAGFIVVGGALGVLPTLALILLAMVAGVALLRRQSVATAMRVRAELQAGRMPAQPLLNGAVLAVAALLLILPGFISDFAAVLLLLPPVRAALVRRIAQRFTLRRTARQRPRPAGPPVLDLGDEDYAALPRHETPWRRGDGGG